MEATTEKLLSLQKLDRELDQIHEEAKVFPDKLAQTQAVEVQRRTQLDTAKVQLETLEREHRDMDGTLKLEEERLKKSKAKVNQLKTGYEFHALQREIEATKRSNTELEENILKKAVEIEDLKKNVEQLTASWQQSADELKKVQEEVSSKMGEFDGILKAKEAERKSAEAGIDRSLLSKYRMIRERKHRDAIVRVSNYACHGCHMNIPPQMMNEMMRKKVVELCPNCHRLIYFEAEPAATS